MDWAVRACGSPLPAISGVPRSGGRRNHLVRGAQTISTHAVRDGHTPPGRGYVTGASVFRRSLNRRTKDFTEARSSAGTPSVSWDSVHGRRAPTCDQPREARRVRPRSVTVEKVCTPGNPGCPCATAPRRRGAVRVPGTGSHRGSAPQDRLAERPPKLARAARPRALPSLADDADPGGAAKYRRAGK